MSKIFCFLWVDVSTSEVAGKAGNFCEKHPETAREIEQFLDRIIPILEKEVSKSDILNQENAPIGGIIAENASRPLFLEKSPEVRKEVIQQIVKSVEDKVIDGKKPQVTGKEVGCNGTRRRTCLARAPVATQAEERGMVALILLGDHALQE